MDRWCCKMKKTSEEAFSTPTLTGCPPAKYRIAKDSGSAGAGASTLIFEKMDSIKRPKTYIF